MAPAGGVLEPELAIRATCLDGWVKTAIPFLSEEPWCAAIAPEATAVLAAAAATTNTRTPLHGYEIFGRFIRCARLSSVNHDHAARRSFRQTLPPSRFSVGSMRSFDQFVYVVRCVNARFSLRRHF
jgi:hypothetical protein